jgi:hypothetical protein
MSANKETHDTVSVPVSPVRVVHRKNVDSALAHDVVVGDHNSRKRSQEHSVTAHEIEESLDTVRRASLIEITLDQQEQTHLASISQGQKIHPPKSAHRTCPRLIFMYRGRRTVISFTALNEFAELLVHSQDTA